jgi:hypothetical protein
VGGGGWLTQAESIAAANSTIRVRTTAADFSDDRYNSVYAQYFQNQAHEADAFQTEQLVAAEITSRNLF